MKYLLVIKPAIPLKDRHKILDLLKELGYNVYASGQRIDKSECDIQFEEVK